MRLTRFYLRNDFLFSFSSYKKKYDDLIELLHSFTDDVIVKRRQELLKSQRDPNYSKIEQDEIGEKKENGIFRYFTALFN